MSACSKLNHQILRRMKKNNFKLIFISIVVLHTLLILLTLSGHLKNLFNDSALGKGQAADFFAVYQAGDNVHKGESVYLDTEGISTNYSYPFRYLPIIGYSLGVILACFKPFTAYYLWILFYEFLLGVNIYLTRKLIKNNDQFLVASVPWLIFSPYLIEIYMGQWSFLLTSILFYTMYGLIQKSKSIWLYVLAPLIKPNAFIVSPILLKEKKFKLLFITILVSMITSFIYFLMFREDIPLFMENFKDNLYSFGGNFGFKSLYYVIFVRHLSIPLPRLWFLIFTIGGGLFIFYKTLKQKDVVISFGLWICYYFLIYKDVWEHHYVLMIPVFVLLVYRYKLSFKKLLSRKNVLILISFLLIALPSLFITQFLWVNDAPVEPESLGLLYTILYHAIKVTGIGCMLYWMLLLSGKNKSRTTVNGWPEDKLKSTV